jgi:hypothetical protein
VGRCARTISANGSWWGSTTGPAGLSRHPVSHDGRWVVVFKASIPNDSYPPGSFVFVRDRMTGETQMLIGVAQAEQAPVVNGDGNQVAGSTAALAQQVN